MTAVKKLYVLLCGYEIVPRSLCLRGGGNRFVMSVPISAYLLKTEQGFVLFDTGLDPALVRDPALRHQHFGAYGWEPPVVWTGHELLRQLAEIEVAPDDVRHVILSHAHLDHTGHVKHFPHAKVWMQSREHAFAFEGPERPGVVRADLNAHAIDWALVEGDHQVMPGLTLLATYGHTPGHQSALVTLPNTGAALLAGNAGDGLKNFTQEILPGEAAAADEALASIRKVNRLRHDHGATMFVCHDPELIQQQKLAPEYYD